jgi:hypothetical protein
MDNGTGDRDICDDLNFRVDRCSKVVAAGIKSNDRCCNAGDECLGGYDASILRKYGLVIKVRGCFFRRGFDRF